MKTIEEKAKAYDEAIKKIKYVMEHGVQPVLNKEDLQEIFPELKESEDERIRKGIIRCVKGNMPDNDFRKKYIAWLEKQKVLTIEEDLQGKEDVLWCIKQAKKYTKNENEMGTCWFAEQWLEKQGEKPQGKSALEAIQEEKVDNANKVEPKFKVEKGKWYVCIKDLLDNYANKAFYKGDTYLSTRDGTLIPCNSNIPFYVEICSDMYFREWTIEDAKDGDILVSGFNKPFIYNGKHNSILVGAYGGITTMDKFMNASEECRWTENVNIHPATKEQRDTLLKAMADAGWQFDFEKKKLKKIEPNPAWSEEDEVKINRIVSVLENLNVADNDILNKDVDWLKSIKERIQPHWKPSGEQIDAFEHFVKSIGESGFAYPHNHNTKCVYSLLNDLKKL